MIPASVRRLAAVALAAAACGVLASCSSSSPAKTAASSTTTNPTPTTSTNVIPSPFQIHQRFGAGDRWEITTASAKRSGSTFTVTLDVLNDGPGAATFAAATPGLFTMLDKYANVPQHASSPVASVQVPVNATRSIVVSFAGVSRTARHPVLWFHGHLLPGVIDASVWFSGV